jgi:PAS domain S-box-containing protein
MKNKTKSFMAVQFPRLRIFALLLLFSGFAFQFPLSPALAEKSPNEIYAGVHRDFPPQYAIDEKTGKPAGFAIETMNEIARRAGLKINYIVFNDWPLMHSALKEGRIDIIPNIGIAKNRAADMDFTLPLETYNISIFVRSSATDIQNIDGLQGQKVAVVTYNIGLSIIQEYGKAMPVIYKSLDEAFLSLLSGNTDALVYPEPSVFLVARRSKLEARIKTAGKPLLEIKRAIAVGKGKPELFNRLNKEVNTFIATPEYAKIYAKWHGSPESYWNARLVLIASGILIALIIILFAVWHFLSLIRLNRNLKNSIEKQKEAEEEIRALLESVQQEKTRLSSLVNSITDEVWFADSQKRFSLANPSALRQFCIDPDQTVEVESLAKNLVVLRPDGSVRPVEEAPPLRALSGEVVTNQEEIIKIPASGEFRYRQVNAAPVRDTAGNIIGSVSVVRDITEKKQAEEELQRTVENLRRAINTTIQVMVSAVETRDPYTAGHQARSADLARAIAMEMGLPQEKIAAIRMAGSIHDIGKLSIPAEILSKPTKLSDLEFALIKEHTRRGFEMLKDVESPWPLAEIVFQHHERMDGSGYPRNLKGEEILIEARILTVADVVEAMASHRPYRPGRGIEAALEEIEKNSGIFYDNTVVDACLRLFREKGFKLEGV